MERSSEPYGVAVLLEFTPRSSGRVRCAVREVVGVAKQDSARLSACLVPPDAGYHADMPKARTDPSDDT